MRKEYQTIYSILHISAFVIFALAIYCCLSEVWLNAASGYLLKDLPATVIYCSGRLLAGVVLFAVAGTIRYLCSEHDELPAGRRTRMGVISFLLGMIAVIMGVGEGIREIILNIIVAKSVAGAYYWEDVVLCASTVSKVLIVGLTIGGVLMATGYYFTYGKGAAQLQEIRDVWMKLYRPILVLALISVAGYIIVCILYIALGSDAEYIMELVRQIAASAGYGCAAVGLTYIIRDHEPQKTKRTASLCRIFCIIMLIVAASIVVEQTINCLTNGLINSVTVEFLIEEMIVFLVFAGILAAEAKFLEKKKD